MPKTNSPDASAPRSPLSLELLVYVLGDMARWQLLAAMADGQGYMVKDLARKIGRSMTATSKQLEVMRRMGVVRLQNRLHQLEERFRPAPGTREVDFGQCVIRLDRF